MKSVFAAAIAILALGGCAMTGHPEQVGSCRPAAAKRLVGKPALDDAELQRQTGSATIRRLAPGDMATKDFRNERLTVTIDGGKVVAASCG